jgi:hypothetical protein
MIRYKSRSLIVLALVVFAMLVLTACGGHGGGGY